MEDDLAGYLDRRRLEGKQANNLVACAIFGFGLVVLAVGTIGYSATENAWEEGEFLTGVMIMVGLLALTVFTGLRARRFGRQARALTGSVRTVPWLPPASADDTSEELAAQIPRLHTISQRVALLCLGWVGVLLVAVGLFMLLERNGQDLLDRGTRVPGTVESTHRVRAGNAWIMVRYSRDGVERTDRINRNSDFEYSPGQTVTVVYDPADPDLVRTLEERNDNRLVDAAAYILVGFGCIALSWGVVAAVRWRKRYLGVRTTGWRSARANIKQPLKGTAKINVTFRDHSTLALQATGFRGLSKVSMNDVPVWIGGADRHMVLLLREGETLRAKPVKATSPREVG